MPGTASRIRSEALEVVLDGVLPAHPPEDRVGPRLDRQVEVLADRVALGQRGDQPIGQVPRMRGHEPQPPDRGLAIGGPQPVDRPDQLGEVRAPGEVQLVARPSARVRHVPEARLGRQVVPVRVDVLAEQRHLAIARRGERPGLLEDVVERPAPLRAAAERHDAVGAGLVAAVDDRQPGRDRRSSRDASRRRRRWRGSRRR